MTAEKNAPKTSPASKHVSFRLNSRVADELHRRAKEQGRPLNALVNSLLVDALFPTSATVTDEEAQGGVLRKIAPLLKAFPRREEVQRMIEEAIKKAMHGSY